MSRPRIAVTGASRTSNGQTRTGVNASYVQAILAAGGLPILFLPEMGRDQTIELFNDCDGLLLTGGEDIDPALYGATPHGKLGAFDPRRDTNEMALVAEARARDLPILGICRGIQLCNVALGGTLFQHLPDERPGYVEHDSPEPRDVRSHEVTVTPESRLATILGTTSFGANSFHHQAIDRLADCLTATAVAPDGVIEGVEGSDPKHWLVAVQWHPEELAHDTDSADLKLFAALITAARRG